MAKGEILGHINCPSCGMENGMRITHDKNGEPFGFCEANCNQQLRVGGDKRRVALFVARYPWAAKQAEKQPEKPVTVTEPTIATSKPIPLQEKRPEVATVTDTPVPEKTQDFLSLMSGRG